MSLSSIGLSHEKHTPPHLTMNAAGAVPLQTGRLLPHKAAENIFISAKPRGLSAEPDALCLITLHKKQQK
jgi:hypothetical protein